MANGHGGVWAGSHEEPTVFWVIKTCSSFFVEGLGSFGMTEVVMSFAVLWMIIMYRDYMGRKVVLCQVMEVCGQMGNSD